MKLFSKLFRHHTIVPTTLLMYFFFLHAGLIPCCPCDSGDSHSDMDNQSCKHCADMHERNINIPALTLASSFNQNHDCGCDEITVPNYHHEERESSYRSIKLYRYHFYPSPSGDTIYNASGMLSDVQHILPPLMGSSTIQSIRTVVILS